MHDIGKDFRTPEVGQHAKTLEILDRLRPDLPLTEIEFTFLQELIDGDILGTYAQHFLKKPKSESRIRLALLLENDSLAGSDLGAYTQEFEIKTEDISDEDLFNTASQLSSQAQKAGLSTTEFYRLLSCYYSCDLSSYTLDAGAYPALEGFLLIDAEVYKSVRINHANKPEAMLQVHQRAFRLRFSTTVENGFKILEEALNL